MIDFKFGFTWLFDKLGYMPKINMEVGKIEEAPWPFPAPKSAVKKKPAAKVIVPKATTRKSAVKKVK
jgi:hypothetical protein